ncbi:MAG: LD-carboxypeptidase [Patescibacteria group bacterium]|nr:LD-carboxypeptidase [Patescibacteria group bacterium]
MEMIVPPRIKKGEYVGFVSPSAGPAPLALHRVENAKRALEKLGYKVKIAPHALQSKGDVSGTPEERVSDMHEMFRDPEVKMIMCTIGGNDSNQLIGRLDYDLIRKNPKIFVGYSDITVLHYAIGSQAGLSTYYGPCAMTQFAEYPEILKYTLDYFNREVSAEMTDEPYQLMASATWTDEFLNWFEKKDLELARKLKPNSGYEWLREGVAEGPAIGGAILSVNHLAGTKYWRDPRRSIFFLDILKEDGLLNENAVGSLLTDLENLGVFADINGLIVSKPAGFSEEETKRLKDTILSRFRDKKCPIAFNVNIGHADPIATIRYGRKLRLDSSKNEIMAL